MRALCPCNMKQLTANNLNLLWKAKEYWLGGKYSGPK